MASRGGVGTFPIEYKHTVFSSSNLVNQSALNGPAALYYAFHHHQDEQKRPKVTLLMGKKVYEQYSGKHDSHFGFSTLYTRTPKNHWLEQHKPNVVFVQMESMGNNFLNFQNDKSNNLLGQLEPFYKHDIVYRYFLSGGNGTSESLAHFLINGPTGNLFFPPFSSITYENSVAFPFKHAGYETVFLTAGDGGWDNLVVMLRHEGFDKVIGRQEILRAFPNAETEPWGTYDEYMFKYAQILLKSAYLHHRPIFIYMNSVTNHPPYSIPHHYKPLPVRVPKALPAFMHISYEDYV